MDFSLSLIRITSLLNHHDIVAVAIIVDEYLLPDASVPIVAVPRVIYDHHLVLPAHPIVIVYNNLLSASKRSS